MPKMKKSDLDLDEKKFKEKLGIKEITRGEFVGQLMHLIQYLEKKKNYEGLSVLHQLIPSDMYEDMVTMWAVGESIKDGLAITKDGHLAIRDIT